ncbi:MAG: hypothetical protein AMJ78_00100 [Omnitrophica WOR_2 bacterium SM23_29]|nr:MAG: hypothetical protein AMJ78_00100 [Omnitrophica WOR_2 bacterium SM23_29]
MEKQSQLELFKFQPHQKDDFKKDRYRPNFFAFIKAHEKAISIIIIFFITSLISFSLGVEKGKRFAKSQIQSTEDKAQPVKSEPERPKQKSPANRVEEKMEKKKDISEYTVQVATFKTNTYAQKEAKRLEKMGIEALIIPSGNFVCVCVGKFSEKQKASTTLNQLKNTYQDCFIRRL